MKKIANWLNKKPATKASWIAAFCGVVTVMFVVFQTAILSQQTDLLRKQTEISQEQLLMTKEQIQISREQTQISREQTQISREQTRISQEQTKIAATQTTIAGKQTQLLSRQIETSIKPYVEIKLENANKNGIDKLIVFNKGNYPIKNIQIIPIYFAHIQEHGWYASVGSNPIYSEDLNQGRKWSRDVSFFPNFYKKPPIADIFIPDEEYLNILVMFERDFDGKSYLTILPGILNRTGTNLDWWSMSMGISGPLSKICDRSLELTYDFLQRKPFPIDYEIYNSNFLLGYKPTGCLGEIKWIE